MGSQRRMPGTLPGFPQGDGGCANPAGQLHRTFRPNPGTPEFCSGGIGQHFYDQLAVHIKHEKDREAFPRNSRKNRVEVLKRASVLHEGRESKDCPDIGC
jgi:hypothetical protein